MRRQRAAEALRGRIAAHQAALNRHEASALSCEERIAAIDVSINLLHSEVGSARPAPVNAWQGKYGKRGDLSAFILKKLHGASPRPTVTDTLCLQVIHHFELDISTAALRRRVRQAVKHALSCFAKQGLVERLPTYQPKSGAGLWRLRQNSPLDQLRATAQAQESARDRPADPAGGEVGGQ